MTYKNKECTFCNKQFDSDEFRINFNFNYINQHAKEFFFEESKPGNYYLISPYGGDVETFDNIDDIDDDNFDGSYFIVSHEEIEAIEELIYDEGLLPIDNEIHGVDYGDYVICRNCVIKSKTTSIFLYLLGRKSYKKRK